MGINVRIESEDGDPEGEVGDPHNLTKHLLPSHSDSNSTCLRFVDHVGDAVFNQLQLPSLISEVSQRVEKLRTADKAAREHGLQILRLLEGAQGRVHTYVRFIGD